MTASIIQVGSQEACDLLSPEYLSKLPEINQETMHRAIMNSSKLWLGMDDTKIIAMWGLIPPTLMSDRAYLWLFTTEHLKGHVFMFIRHSKRAVEEMLEEFPLIVGHAKVGSDRSIQWLRWLGAEFGEPVNNVAIPFTIKAKQWQQDLAQSA
jgi:hypothetical protein